MFHPCRAQRGAIFFAFRRFAAGTVRRRTTPLGGPSFGGGNRLGRNRAHFIGCEIFAVPKSRLGVRADHAAAARRIRANSEPGFRVVCSSAKAPATILRRASSARAALSFFDLRRRIAASVRSRRATSAARRSASDWRGNGHQLPKFGSFESGALKAESPYLNAATQGQAGSLRSTSGNAEPRPPTSVERQRNCALTVHPRRGGCTCAAGGNPLHPRASRVESIRPSTPPGKRGGA